MNSCMRYQRIKAHEIRNLNYSNYKIVHDKFLLRDSFVASKKASEICMNEINAIVGDLHNLCVTTVYRGVQVTRISKDQMNEL